MKRRVDKSELRANISEAFTFVRFLISNPKMFKKIRNGAEIRILPAASGKVPPFPGLRRGAQVFTSETIFHYL
ncbi:MAG: hypothetical protein A2X28_06300 [Elusimicrobia bacterium GWA2_56_46]|nr:MAG: hypothetical protein A2X28_06300 [Elusimicrobia bacterium GWA2_56_46]OGR54639.1 MAG: hypothetical protein A2X39_02350 [Elusimicrobia bacterium GWC2_56_31]HBB67487.1 hypothetical protein [Elusimicrobiota bacterium]HBW23875.1 hypothetical protein [Elusimicrobiota bacterium]